LCRRDFFRQQDNRHESWAGFKARRDASFPAMQIGDGAGLSTSSRNDPAVQNVIAFTGGGGAANSGFVYLALKPLEERQTPRRGPGHCPAAAQAPTPWPGASLFFAAGPGFAHRRRMKQARKYQYTISKATL